MADHADPFNRAVSAPLATSENRAGGVIKVSFTHDAMIDLIIAEPAISQGMIAKHFGYTEGWVSRIFNSDAFQARLAQRRNDVIDPTLIMSLEEKFRVLADVSTDILIDKLHLSKSADLAIQALPIVTKALGYGAKQSNVNLQQNFVVALPAKQENEKDWAAKHRSPTLAQMVAEVTDAEPVNK